jgi:lipoprotein NlpI
MRYSMLFIGIAALLAAASPALAASQSDWLQCADVTNAANADENIAVCGRILGDVKETAQYRALAFTNRCGLWETKGEPDRALPDCNQAIVLDPKYAPAYSNRGIAYYAKGDYDHAIADYDQAISLNPRFSDPYFERGRAYYAEGDYDRAIADENAAIQLDPKDTTYYYTRGGAYFAKADYGHAIADYTAAIGLDAKYAYSYRARGRGYLYGGNLAKALADVIQASKLDPTDAYNALWVEIASQRNKAPSQLSQAISRIDMTTWPAPVIRMFLGQAKPAAVLAAAENSDARKKKGQICEANFYSGELALQQGAKDEATRLFRSAVSDCPKSFDEWANANAELKALGAAR